VYYYHYYDYHYHIIIIIHRPSIPSDERASFIQGADGPREGAQFSCFARLGAVHGRHHQVSPANLSYLHPIDMRTSYLNKNCSNLVFMLWGAYAQKKGKVSCPSLWW
jgi:hypothetical protein